MQDTMTFKYKNKFADAVKNLSCFVPNYRNSY